MTSVLRRVVRVLLEQLLGEQRSHWLSTDNIAVLERVAHALCFWLPLPAAVDLETLLRRVEIGSVNLKPRYQRGFIWNQLKAYRLIESVCAGLFVPAVVTHTQIVDGMEVSWREHRTAG